MNTAILRKIDQPCSPCVLDVLCGVFDRQEAIDLAWEVTCFPFSCIEAIPQALDFIAACGLSGMMAL